MWSMVPGLTSLVLMNSRHSALAEHAERYLISNAVLICDETPLGSKKDDIHLESLTSLRVRGKLVDALRSATCLKYVQHRPTLSRIQTASVRGSQCIGVKSYIDLKELGFFIASESGAATASLYNSSVEWSGLGGTAAIGEQAPFSVEANKKNAMGA